MAAELSYGQGKPLNLLDRWGQWLSLRRVRAELGDGRGERFADIGCGFEARLAQGFFEPCQSVTLVDVAVDPAYKRLPKVKVIEGLLPQALKRVAPLSLDAIILNSVLEHLEQPEATLAALHRCLKPHGRLWVNVPNWRGKWVLELLAFRLGLAPADGVDDHKRYFTPRELWPLLVAGGFKPSAIRCGTHKLGLNTWAVCQKAG